MHKNTTKINGNPKIFWLRLFIHLLKIATLRSEAKKETRSFPDVDTRTNTIIQLLYIRSSKTPICLIVREINHYCIFIKAYKQILLSVTSSSDAHLRIGPENSED